MREGKLTIDGRLTNALVPDETKHPAVLPSSHPVMERLVSDIHEQCAHSDLEYVLAELRRRYWVVGAANLVRRTLAKCVICRRREARPCTQMEADLPTDRVRPEERAFTNVGVDFFGPINIRRGRGTEKRYGCIFTCLTTQAVHLEVAAALDTDSFLNCLYRFTARRGSPKIIRSDNGRNFVGAERELRAVQRSWNQGWLQDELSSKGIKWLFNPPAASHIGGVRERQIRTVRRILAALVKEQILTHDALETLLVTAEGIVNNRPITAVSSEPRDLESLTPNHLLLHRPAVSPPSGSGEVDSTRRKWKQVQYMADLFWKPSLHQRTKWQKPHRNVAKNDLVLLLEKQLTRNNWPMGRVVEPLR